VYTERTAIFSELDYHVNYLPSRSVRTREWKYIKNYSDLPVGLDELDTTDWAIKLAHLPDQPWNRPRVPEELYHLASDPSEKNNLATDQQYSMELAHLRQLLLGHQRETSDPFLDREFTYDWRAD
jgi:arylsulfatase A-like enzyme